MDPKPGTRVKKPAQKRPSAAPIPKVEEPVIELEPWQNDYKIDIVKVLYDKQIQLRKKTADGYVPFSVDSGWVYLKKDL